MRESDPEAVADVCRAMADPTRLWILRRLSECTMTAGDLAYELGIPQSSLSYHLSQLNKAGLVIADRQGKWRWYGVLIDGFILLDEYIRPFISDSTEDEL